MRIIQRSGKDLVIQSQILTASSDKSKRRLHDDLTSACAYFTNSSLKSTSCTYPCLCPHSALKPKIPFKSDLHLCLHFGRTALISAFSPGLTRTASAPPPPNNPAARSQACTLLQLTYSPSWPRSQSGLMWRVLLCVYVCDGTVRNSRSLDCISHPSLSTFYTPGLFLGTLLIWESQGMTTTSFPLLPHLHKIQGYFPVSPTTMISALAKSMHYIYFGTYILGTVFHFQLSSVFLFSPGIFIIYEEKMTLGLFLQKAQHKSTGNRPGKYLLLMEGTVGSARVIETCLINTKYYRLSFFIWMRQHKRNSQEKYSYPLVKENELNHNWYKYKL